MMKTTQQRTIINGLVAAVLMPSLLLAGEDTGSDATGSKGQVAKSSTADFLQPFGSIRARYEFGDVDGFEKSTLGTIRSRIGIKTRSLNGLSFLAEGEHTYVLTGRNKYRPFPGFPPASRTVIADPDNFQLNRLQVMYHSGAIDSSFIVGRQEITYDDQRFIGAVGWRQNDQTFDAIRFENTSLDQLKFSYAYISQVNRIFGAQTPVRGLQEWDSDSHLVQLEYTGIENHKLRIFSYLLDFDNAASNSTNTFGVEFTGTRDSSLGEMNYLFTAAVQKDAADNPLDYQEYYLRGELGIKQASYDYGVGAEMMTSDGAGTFLFPLGTNHKFNGYADAFLTTPANGLIDSYGWVGTKAFGIGHKFALHNFQSEELSSSLGWELDYVASKQLCASSLAIFKVSYLNGDNAQADTTRASLELNYTF